MLKGAVSNVLIHGSVTLMALVSNMRGINLVGHV